MTPEVSDVGLASLASHGKNLILRSINSFVNPANWAFLLAFSMI